MRIDYFCSVFTSRVSNPLINKEVLEPEFHLFTVGAQKLFSIVAEFVDRLPRRKEIIQHGFIEKA